MEIKERRLFFNFEKEEQWLNEKAAEGLNFISYRFGRYTFEESTPGEYIYRIELLKNPPTDEESQDYLIFLEDTGVECVDTYGNWAYFRKKAADGPFEIYSDVESKAGHYRRIAYMFAIIGVLNLFIAVFNLSISEFNMYLSIVNFLVFVLFTPVVIIYLQKINALKKAHDSHDK